MLVGERHIPNLLIVELENDDTPRIFRNGKDGTPSCIHLFLDWLEELSETFKQLIVIAHNFKGYDSYPIVDAYHECCPSVN